MIVTRLAEFTNQWPRFRVTHGRRGIASTIYFHLQGARQCCTGLVEYLLTAVQCLRQCSNCCASIMYSFSGVFLGPTAILPTSKTDRQRSLSKARFESIRSSEWWHSSLRPANCCPAASATVPSCLGAAIPGRSPRLIIWDMRDSRIHVRQAFSASAATIASTFRWAQC